MPPAEAGMLLRRAAGTLGEGFSELLWPTRCVGCNLPGGLLCPSCEEGLERIERRWSCPVCGAPYGWLTCTACERDWTELDGCVCALSFGGTSARLVSVHKDGHERRLAPLIARLMAEAIPEEWRAEGAGLDAIVFVPATARAFARRGFDHMESVANELSRFIDAPVADVLVREEGHDQRGLGREERALNLEGRVFAVEDVAGMRILLVDDVITTGASIRACAAALKERGAS